jgi:hypothetical protein
MQLIAGVFRVRKSERGGGSDFCGRDFGDEVQVQGVVLRVTIGKE